MSAGQTLAGWKRTSEHSIQRGVFDIARSGPPERRQYLLWQDKKIFGPFTDAAAAVAMADQLEKA